MYERTLEVIDQLTTDITVKSIINSINKNQVKSKLWLVDKARPFIEMIPEPSICVAAGWYGHLAGMLRDLTYGEIVSYDMDVSCEVLGKKLQKGKNITFETKAMQDFEPWNYNINICTSCEHISQEDINLYIKKMKPGSLKILQSNNYVKIKEHINCRNNLDDFVKDYKSQRLLFKGKLELEEYERYMVIFT